MFDFGNANDGQRKAIAAADGPVLITAGPGTGKTYTLVQRAIYLIEECNVRPESIFIATFTEKAAKELVTRITNELANRNITANINEMYIGTFHSLCLRMLKEHLEYTRLRRNYRLMDSFDQQYMVFQNIHRFRSIPEIEIVLPNGGAWKQAETICNFVNNLSEELVSPEELMSDHDPSIASLGRMLQEYRTILTEANLMDFSSIQIEAYRLLCDNEGILNELRSAITHIMVDEYQDTNYIQEQLVFLLAGERKNICVVGDDDQGLYRFRGATIRNILEFPQKFANGECRIIPLVINYRSNSDIVDFYNRWMDTTDGAKFKFRWENFRYEKRIEPHEKSALHSPAVVKLAGVNDEDEWHEKILQFINNLKTSGKLMDYNQIAFLFNSVKHPRVTALARFLEENHINVYSPRSDMFFQRDEIRLALGCLMLMFPFYVQGLENGEYTFLQPEHLTYYRNCIMLANEYLMQPEHTDLLKWIRRRGKDHVSLTDATDYAYCGLMYQMFEFQPFAGILDTDMDVGVVDIRPARNLAKLTQIIGKFEYLHRVDVLSADKYRGKRGIDANTELLFNLYLRLLYDGGITEYEDDSEYAPSGCVSFLTIHQSKGILFYSKTPKYYYERVKVPLDKPVKRNRVIWNGKTKALEVARDGQGKIIYDEFTDRFLDSVWEEDVLNIGQTSVTRKTSSENLNYPTQKPKRILELIIEASSQPGDLVFDCFMGSGTTQSVAMKLGRRFIGADINLGAIQTTTKRLLSVAKELENSQTGMGSADDTKYTGFEVYNVNNYDFFRNPVEARDLLIAALEIQPFPQSDIWDGELDGRMVKIMPVNRIATKADLKELLANLPYKTYEKRKEENPNQPVERITIVCMGHEPDLKGAMEQELTDYKVDIQIMDILRDKADLQLKRDSEAEIVREGGKLVIRAFYPMNLMQKLSLQKEYVEDWRQLVDSVMIDWNYDGVVMQPAVTDVPGKSELVKGIYDIPEGSGTIKVKITDLLSESLEVEVR